MKYFYHQRLPFLRNSDLHFLVLEDSYVFPNSIHLLFLRGYFQDIHLEKHCRGLADPSTFLFLLNQLEPEYSFCYCTRGKFSSGCTLHHLFLRNKHLNDGQIYCIRCNIFLKKVQQHKLGI